jgi:hypothetical protein
MTFSLRRHRIDKIPREVILAELRRVAEHYRFQYFTGREFNRASSLCTRATVMNNFGSWNAALEATTLKLEKRRIPRRDRIPDRELFRELERIWRLLGHRPSRAEWEASDPRFHYSTYKTHFGTWLKACIRFIEFNSGTSIIEQSEIPVTEQILDGHIFNQPIISDEDKRSIPLKLRLTVLERDGFTCVLCGRTPATERGVVLHIDHKEPFSKGGKTGLSNLRTLCRECNLGKGSDRTS